MRNLGGIVATEGVRGGSVVASVPRNLQGSKKRTERQLDNSLLSTPPDPTTALKCVLRYKTDN